MKPLLIFLSVCFILMGCEGENNDPPASPYLQNRAPLKENPYLELPLGSITPAGWLEDQLHRMAEGMTGHLDSIYPEVVGPRNGWLGGDGDGWERGPYWIDGLLPLAYILDDEKLKQKVKPWIEWTLEHQTEEGYLGPVPFEEAPEYEPGIQRGNRMDWWPKMVMLKALQQYYSATGDERVITALTRYFEYQLRELPERPLDYLTLWANRRGGDNLMVVYWLYNITGDEFLLELGDIIQEQTFPWTEVFLNRENNAEIPNPWYYNQVSRYPFDSAEINSLSISKIGSFHTVNLAQGLKEPVIAYQKDRNEEHLRAVRKALGDIKRFHGQPQGMYGGDEPLHGSNPVQGIELCSVAEGMFSLETMTRITGDMAFADQLERIAYNALPAQASDDYSSRQYFQAANQVELSDRISTSFEAHNHGHTDFVFGVLTGYPCCTTNMHQTWPKFVQNLFYATADGGVAALQYAPASAALIVAGGTDLRIVETTGYPFRENVQFEMNLSASAEFPFHLRIPGWTDKPVIQVNGQDAEYTMDGNIAVIDRQWDDGDKVTLTLPMHVRVSTWYQFTKTVERGPLVYSLRIHHRMKEKDRNDRFGSFWEVYPVDPWNYGLLENDLENPSENIEIVENNWDGRYPWNLENAPVHLELNGYRTDEWKLLDGTAPIPAFWRAPAVMQEDLVRITLVPYGCTTLRITEFPVYEVAE